jgi:hypothetical protein
VEAQTETQTEPGIPVITLSRKQAALALGLSVSTLDALTKCKKIGVCRSGRRKVYLRRHLEEYLAAIERPRAA